MGAQTLNAILGKHLKWRMEKNGLTVSAMARRSGLPVSAIRRLRRGGRWTIEDLFSLAIDGFDKEPDEFLTFARHCEKVAYVFS